MQALQKLRSERSFENEREDFLSKSTSSEYPLFDYVVLIRKSVAIIQKTQDGNVQREVIRKLINTPTPRNFNCQFLTPEQERDLADCISFFEDEDDSDPEKP